MNRPILNILLLLALIFQSVVAVGAGTPSAEGAEQHCLGHELEQNDCACCADGGAMNAGCTVQCSVSQAPIVMLLPVRLAGGSVCISTASRAFQNPAYAPLIPPPIS